MQIHFGPDPRKVLDDGETVAAMKDARAEGKIRFLGASTGGEIALRCIASGDFDVLQLEYSLTNRSDERIVRLCGERGIGVLVRGGLAYGRLTTRVIPHLAEPERAGESPDRGAAPTGRWRRPEADGSGAAVPLPQPSRLVRPRRLEARRAREGEPRARRPGPRRRPPGGGREDLRFGFSGLTFLTGSPSAGFAPPADGRLRARGLQTRRRPSGRRRRAPRRASSRWPPRTPRPA